MGPLYIIIHHLDLLDFLLRFYNIVRFYSECSFASLDVLLGLGMYLSLFLILYLIIFFFFLNYRLFCPDFPERHFAPIIIANLTYFTSLLNDVHIFMLDYVWEQWAYISLTDGSHVPRLCYSL